MKIHRHLLALCWGIGKTDSGRRIGLVSGGNVGGRAALAFDPASKTVVAIAANFEGPRVTEEARKLLDLFANYLTKATN